MKKNNISKFFTAAIFSSILLLVLFGISASNAKAQNLGSFTVNKDFCVDNNNNTCNGQPDSFPNNVQFTVEQGTFDEMTKVFTPTGGTFANISVDIPKNGKGSTKTDDIFTAGATFRVCEVVPDGFESLPRPGSTTGGNNQFTGSMGCLVITNITSGNNVLNFLNIPLAPTAAAVTVRGRVLSPYGKGVFRARVMMTDSTGQTRTVMTNPFGFYTFGNIEVGDTYILQVRHKRYTFTPQALSLTEEATDVNFTAQR
ncbi:MAG: carboxypeptidase-like regulatory domain-containing protein [Segetibacter sp.]